MTVVLSNALAACDVVRSFCGYTAAQMSDPRWSATGALSYMYTAYDTARRGEAEWWLVCTLVSAVRERVYDHWLYDSRTHPALGRAMLRDVLRGRP